MTDGLPPGLDGPRPLPPDLRARLEALLLAAASAPERAEGAAARAEVGEAAAAVDAELAGIMGAAVGPRPMPPRLRRRLEAAMVAEGRRLGDVDTATRRQRWWAETRRLRIATTAAALLLVMATTYFTSRSLSGPDVAGPTTTANADRPAPPPFGLFAADVAGAVDGTDGDRAPVARAPLTVSVVRGDAAQEAGFAAYVALLNESGGVDGHRLVVVDAGSPESAGSVATVNLSGTPVVTDDLQGPAFVGRGPLLETLAVPEAVLRGRVFSTASPVRRQARVAVDAVFPETADGVTAVIYEGIGPVWGADVPEALAEGLRARGARAVRVPVADAATPTLVPASVAFLSMPTADAAAWLEAARAAGYAPPVPVVGVASLLEPSLAALLPEGSVVVSPYRLEGLGPETQQLRRRLGGEEPGAAAVHGWVTAKALAVSLWQERADSPAEAVRGLAGLDGWEEGYTDAWATRAGTNARTPDGLVFAVQDGRFEEVPGFRTDPF